MKKITFFLCFLIIGVASYGQSDKTEKTDKNAKAKVEFPAYVDQGTIPNFSIIPAPDSLSFNLVAIIIDFQSKFIRLIKTLPNAGFVIIQDGSFFVIGGYYGYGKCNNRIQLNRENDF